MATQAGYGRAVHRRLQRVTAAIHTTCNSYGSRLHKCQDRTWLAYARWPDAATRDRCEHREIEGQRLMREAVAENYEDILGEVVSSTCSGNPMGSHT